VGHAGRSNGRARNERQIGPAECFEMISKMSLPLETLLLDGPLAP